MAGSCVTHAKSVILREAFRARSQMPKKQNTSVPIPTAVVFAWNGPGCPLPVVIAPADTLTAVNAHQTPRYDDAVTAASLRRYTV